MTGRHLFILIELVISLIISVLCLLVHFRQHFRLQCINRHYTQPRIVSQLNQKITGIQTPAQEPSQFTTRASIFSKETLVHPEDAIQWCLRSIDEQEFDFFPYSFMCYQLFLICLLSIIFSKFLLLDNNLDLVSIDNILSNITISSNSGIILTQSSLLHRNNSSLIDWIIIYGVLILTNWEALFVFYRYYSTRYTAKYFNTVSNMIIFKLFTVYAVFFILLFVAQIHFYYYLFPFIILFMSLFIIFCSYRTSVILVNQFKQMELMLENFGSNREIQKTMSKSVYFMRNTSMISSVCCIIYLSVLLISYNICIVFYLPCIWSIVCILFTLNFIRNRRFVTNICCCNICKSKKSRGATQKGTQFVTRDPRDVTNPTSLTSTMSMDPEPNPHDADTQNQNKNLQLHSNKSATATITYSKTAVVHHHGFETDIDEHKARNDLSLGVLYDTDAEEYQSTNEEEDDDDDAYNFDENGTVRIYPGGGLTRQMSPHSDEHSKSLEDTSHLSETQPPGAKNMVSKELKLRINNLANVKAKSHEPFEKSASVRSAKTVRFKMDPRLGSILEQNQSKLNVSPPLRRAQSERPHMESATQVGSLHSMTRSPSVSKSVEPSGRPSLENNMNNSNPVKRSSQISQTQISHTKSQSFHHGDGNREEIRKKKKASRRTLSRRVVFSKLPHRMQILPDVQKHKVEEFANLNHMMTLHGFCEPNRFFQFELHEI